MTSLPPEHPARQESAETDLSAPDVAGLDVTDVGRGVAHLEPLDVDGVHTVAVGSALWLVAFLALLPFMASLRDADRLWWLWTCVTGFGFGVLGLGAKESMDFTPHQDRYEPLVPAQKLYRRVT